MRRESFTRQNVCCLVLVALILTGCAQKAKSLPPRAAPDDTVAESPLPDKLGSFVGGVSTPAGSAVRRTYRRAATTITVTLAQFPMNSAQYAHWVKISTDGFPQAKLDLPGAEANGFYQCTDAGRCDLLIQLRAGIHVEIRGDGSSSRADVDEIAHALNLARFVANQQ